MVDKKLKMNCFEVELNPNLNERMSVRQYTSYEHICHMTVNVESTMKEKKMSCTIRSRGTRRKEINEKATTSKVNIKGLERVILIAIIRKIGSLATGLR